MNERLWRGKDRKNKCVGEISMQKWYEKLLKGLKASERREARLNWMEKIIGMRNYKEGKKKCVGGISVQE